jgi:hypothetical protein
MQNPFKDVEIVSDATLISLRNVIRAELRTCLGKSLTPVSGRVGQDPNQTDNALGSLSPEYKGGAVGEKPNQPELPQELIDRIVMDSLLICTGPESAIDMRNHFDALTNVSIDMRRKLFAELGESITAPHSTQFQDQGRGPAKPFNIDTVKAHALMNVDNQLNMREALFEYIVSIIALERRRLYKSGLDEVRIEMSCPGPGSVSILIQTKKRVAFISMSSHAANIAHTIILQFPELFTQVIEMQDSIEFADLIKLNNHNNNMILLFASSVPIEHVARVGGRGMILESFRKSWIEVGKIHSGDIKRTCLFLENNADATKIESGLDAARKHDIEQCLISISKGSFLKRGLQMLYGAMVYHMGTFDAQQDGRSVLFEISGYNLDTIVKMVVDGFTFRFDDCIDAKYSAGYQELHTTCLQKYTTSRFARDDRISFMPFINRTISEQSALLLRLPTISIDITADYARVDTAIIEQKIDEIKRKINNTREQLARMQMFSSTEMLAIVGTKSASAMYKSVLGEYSDNYDFIHKLSMGIRPTNTPKLIQDVYVGYTADGFFQLEFAQREQTLAGMKQVLSDQLGLFSMRKHFKDDAGHIKRALVAIKQLEISYDTLETSKSSISRVLSRSGNTRNVIMALKHFDNMVRTPLIAFDMQEHFYGAASDPNVDIQRIIDSLSTKPSILPTDENVKQAIETLSQRADKYHVQIAPFDIFQRTFEKHLELETALSDLQKEFALLSQAPQGGGKYKKSTIKLVNRAYNLQKPIYIKNKKQMYARYKGRYIDVAEYQRLKKLQGYDWTVSN